LKKFAYVACATAFFLFSCTPNVIINQNWRRSSPAAKSLAIVIPDSVILVDYKGNVKDEFGEGNMDSLIRANVKAILLDRVIKKTCFKNARLDQFSSPFQTVEKKLADGFYIGIPKDTLAEMLSKSNADYVLSVYKMNISSMVGWSPYDNSPSKFLAVYSRFFVWDNTQKCVVAYGYTQNNDDNGYYTKKDDWIKIVDETVNKIFETLGFLRDLETEKYNSNREMLQKP
jgi:hypothetical protein